MALGSQSGQQIGRNRYMYRRRKGRSGKWIGVLVLLGACGVVVWLLVPGPQTTQATDSTKQAPLGSQPEVRSTPTPTTEPTRSSRASSLLSTNPMPVEPTVPTRIPSRIPETTPTRTPVEAAITQTPTQPAEAGTGEPSEQRPEAGVGTARVAALRALAERDPIDARRQLSDLVASGTLGPAESMEARAELNTLGEILLFDPSMLPKDPFVDRYVVQPGDSLSRIAQTAGMNSEWTMLKRINRITNPNSIRVGQSLKIPVGTFHARVSKSEYIMDLFLENEHGRVLIASCPVGLGEFDATPTGRFVVREQSKLTNPQWRNPRTGEFFYSDDPANPIGERWIGIKGIDSTNNELLGYGIHGTIEPDSIGKMESMGCIRMHDEDVKLVYDALTEKGSLIEIVP